VISLEIWLLYPQGKSSSTATA